MKKFFKRDKKRNLEAQHPELGLFFWIAVCLSAAVLFSCSKEEPVPIRMGDDEIVTVTFKGNGKLFIDSLEEFGDILIDSLVQKIIKGEKATIPPFYAYTGSRFLGWHTDIQLTKIFDFNTPITENITLYAKWEKSSIQKNYRIAVIKYRCKDTNTKWRLTPAQQDQLKTGLNTLYKELSFGKFEIPTMDFYDRGAINFTYDEVFQNAYTSGYINLTHKKNPNKSFEEIKSLAQQNLDKDNAYFTQIGDTILLRKINTSLLESLDGDAKFKSYELGELIIRIADMPSSVNISSYDVITFIVEHEFPLGIAIQSSFVTGVGIKQNGAEVITGSPYILVYVGSGSFDNRYSVGPGDGRPRINKIGFLFAHELVHAIGLGTHDFGFCQNPDRIVADTQADIDAFKNGSTNYSNLEYGDHLSVSGRGLWGSGLAPSSREYLGWLDASKVTYLERSKTGVEINEVNETNGVLFTKIPVKRAGKDGFLYVSFSGGTGYQSQLKQIASGANTRGVLIFYADKPPAGIELTSSILVDADGKAGDDILALLPGKTYSYLGVTISNVSVNGTKASFDVAID